MGRSKVRPPKTGASETGWTGPAGTAGTAGSADDDHRATRAQHTVRVGDEEVLIHDRDRRGEVTNEPAARAVGPE